MPEIESNFTLILAGIGLLCVVAFVAKSLWQPLFRRVWHYFLAWWERDARAERELELLKKARKQAEAEMNADLEEETPEIEPATTPDIKRSAPTMRDIERSESARRIRPTLSEESQRTLRN